MKILAALAVVTFAVFGATMAACADDSGATRRPMAYTTSVPQMPLTFGAYTSTRPPVRQEQGTYCRPYSRTINQAGYHRESYGTACLQSDGSWRTVR